MDYLGAATMKNLGRQAHKISGIRWPLLLLALVVALVPFWSGQPSFAADAYTVTGTIKTPTGGNAKANDVIVKHIKVIVMDEDILFDDIMGTAHTDSSGNFSIGFTPGFFNDTPDIFINVEYLGTAVSGRFIEVRLANGDANVIKNVNIEGVVHSDRAPGPFPMGVLRVTDTRANIVTQIGDAMRYLKGQWAGYNMPNNMNVEGRTNSTGSFVSADGSYTSISRDDYNTPGPGTGANSAYSDIHHETMHWVAYRSYGNRRINFLCNANPHFSSKESCEGFAMQEGGAQWFGNASSRSNGVVDQKNSPPVATTWRGSDGTGSDNSGEIVEGALLLAWNGTSAGTHGDVPGVLEAMLGSATDSMKEFKDAYSTLKGAQSAAMNTFLNAAAANGMVYTRGFLNTFAEGDPPDAGPPSNGNHKLIDGVTYLRGNVIPEIRQLTRTETPLAANSATVAANQKDLGYKTAVDGDTQGAPPTGALFTFIGPVTFGSTLTFDTKVPGNDGDYDLIVRLRNTHNWVDNFLPDFTGDGNNTVNFNEEWLKKRGTWWSLALEPNNDDEGKVVIDNTAPKVTANSLKPN